MANPTGPFLSEIEWSAGDAGGCRHRPGGAVRGAGPQHDSMHAQFEDGSVSVEAGLMEMLTRMETGKFKVFSPLLDWFEEFRLYHRKDGKVVKEGDDLLAATRYGVMMLRFAETIYRKRKRTGVRLSIAAIRTRGWTRDPGHFCFAPSELERGKWRAALPHPAGVGCTPRLGVARLGGSFANFPKWLMRLEHALQQGPRPRCRCCATTSAT